MISYLNIGLHAQIAMNFEKNRSKGSNVKNKLIYVLEGMKKLMCMKPIKV
jgi:hypothetical protein